ncbi:cytochrome P450 2J2-like [Patiria miniata]|uniref:Cytochrome P450 n=1 Tax=Patiria miniata TaxID=46514 RepID=A0A913ZKU1_PATMI|nr:cytochrome P450 2J2-like [Patiria miniata]XP_038051663.1 cytochrome P450 2J2-like [Patiria miniata]XP_038051664.1 cytochrome P450 2J2-like [Patiria miniata]XP_038051665.1 cytochrome P450 2J2-like [Patiria miniata]XP_038051666.1 cytochrome P450 2J2-like [Patiria miniata]
MEILAALTVLDVRTILLGIAVFLVVLRFLRRPRNPPPGPWGWPFLGNLPQLMLSGGEMHENFSKLTARYGNVVSINLAGMSMVVLHGHNTVKEAFSRQQLSDRPPAYMTTMVAPGHGFLASSGENWVELRRFSMTVLKKLGVGKSAFEQNIVTEAEIFLEEVQKHGGEAFDPKPALGNAVGNIISMVVFGKRFQYTDPSFKRLQQANSDLALQAGAGSVFEFSPVFNKLTMLPFVRSYAASLRNYYGQINQLIAEHSKEKSADHQEDLIDIFLSERKIKEEQGVENAALRPRNLQHIVGDLFGAGSETTATSLRWGMLYMMAYPEIQTRVQKELDDVTARNRLPRIADKPELPYTEAVLCEIQRIGTISPLGLPHATTEDTTIAGYNIPKGMTLMYNIWHNHFDPLVWEEPEKFRPERFLDGDGKFRSREEFMPFGTGRRMCLGEHLAKMELFVFFTYLLHHFTMKKPDHVPAVSFEVEQNSSLRAPQNFDICLIARD